MKHTQPAACLSPELLRYVRDQSPTTEEFIARFGGPGGGVFHLLRKEGLLVEEKGRLRLSPTHLSPDGMHFTFGCSVFHLDSNQVDWVRWGIGS
jgi:hypothetical protein